MRTAIEHRNEIAMNKTVQGEQNVIATDLLRYLPEGIRAITNVPNPD